jgi:hypothetical protein
MFSVAFLISWHRPQKVKEMLEGADQGFSEGAKSREFCPSA